MAATARDVLAHYGIAIAQQMGSELRCLCPFHEDHTPSLDMNSEKGLWVCRAGCGGGPLETFVMRMEKVPLAVAKILLANDFVLYEGSREDEFYKLCAEVERGREEDVAEVGDAATRREVVQAIFRYMSITPQLPTVFVCERVRILIYIMSDKELYPKKVYMKLHQDFNTCVMEVT